MGGKVARRWVAKLQGDGWLSCKEMGDYVARRWVAKLVAYLLAKAALWVRMQTSPQNRYKMGDISKGMAYIL
jgi:hypothetical protein